MEYRLPAEAITCVTGRYELGAGGEGGGGGLGKAMLSDV